MNIEQEIVLILKKWRKSPLHCFLREINSRKATGYDHTPGKIIRIAYITVTS